ncbi:DNA ligase-1 [Chitinophaga terrae (ex Kim and Jung 2007)]|uniref:DNA ligase (ATP) n=1 Tax=Chitinophaga terrae (ex Kim and Jung 2007) TaxID=408074 RepID=A0A1H4DG27_9BACT|nr:ATP-dependent DNA ligase [Chitinophaga terrae (ex Kim and Jung 2007)]GEP92686.1 ATP-dependent DNA ligase [Chitinophaga terrae (ex Kim and Jung 2007)]SEA71456.1 DNA ligase-1 [Chitinophaga terrae (ex Kim and Jung 2007)]
MQQFSELVKLLSNSTKTNEKLAALSQYFATAPDKDKTWVLALFSGRRPKRTVNSTQLRNWCIEVANLPEWLFDECYHTVGDLAETIALLLPPGTKPISAPLHYWLEQLMRLEKADESVKHDFILQTWDALDRNERFVFNKLITGGFRIGVSQKMMVNALAQTYQIPAPTLSHMLSGNWNPYQVTIEDLLHLHTSGADASRPYPFYLAYALEDTPQALGSEKDWQAEWKWDGIRGQIIKRENQLFVWSRGEELITEKFPEFQSLTAALPNGTVIDGEILTFMDGSPLPFQTLQTRIGRKNITKKQLQEAPVVFLSYDLLEYEESDIREEALAERRAKLEELVARINDPVLKLSPVIGFESWEELIEQRLTARSKGSEGLMLKKLSAPYQVGRKRGDWWKWKIDPFTIDAVMIYAQKGHGRRSNLYTDYTFAVKNGDQLIPFTKAYSGLTDKEITEVDRWVKQNSIEKFGPVRTVTPTLVFEIAFEGIAASNRHKSGVALRFPRINRWRKDKPVDEINTLEDLKELLRKYESKE